MAFETCPKCGELVASVKRHIVCCTGKSSEEYAPERPKRTAAKQPPMERRLVPPPSPEAIQSSGGSKSVKLAVRQEVGADRLTPPVKSSDGAALQRKANPGRARDNLGRASGLASHVLPSSGNGTPTNLPSEAKRKKGRPRIGEVRDRQWEKLGMSERTWYRRQKEKGQ